MKPEKTSEIFVQNLLLAMPNWHSRLVRPFKESLKNEMSLETYYCLQTIRICGNVTMSELAKQLGIPKQQVTRLIDRLSEHLFVERLTDETDRRVIRIRLTERAVSYLDGYYLKSTDFIRSLEQQLTEEELRKLNNAVETLTEILLLFTP